VFVDLPVIQPFERVVMSSLERVFIENSSFYPAEFVDFLSRSLEAQNSVSAPSSLELLRKNVSLYASQNEFLDERRDVDLANSFRLLSDSAQELVVLSRNRPEEFLSAVPVQDPEIVWEVLRFPFLDPVLAVEFVKRLDPQKFESQHGNMRLLTFPQSWHNPDLASVLTVFLLKAKLVDYVALPVLIRHAVFSNRLFREVCALAKPLLASKQMQGVNKELYLSLGAHAVSPERTELVSDLCSSGASYGFLLSDLFHVALESTRLVSFPIEDTGIGLELFNLASDHVSKSNEALPVSFRYMLYTQKFEHASWFGSGSNQELESMFLGFDPEVLTGFASVFTAQILRSCSEDAVLPLEFASANFERQIQFANFYTSEIFNVVQASSVCNLIERFTCSNAYEPSLLFSSRNGVFLSNFAFWMVEEFAYDFEKLEMFLRLLPQFEGKVKELSVLVNKL